MDLAPQAIQEAGAQLCRRIELLTAALPDYPVARLAGEVDEIRRLALGHGLDTVADIARSLESALAISDGCTIVLPFLEKMREAAECGQLYPGASQAFLAAINQRLYG